MAMSKHSNPMTLGLGLLGMFVQDNTVHKAIIQVTDKFKN